MNLDDILKERGGRYGLFKDNAVIAQELKEVMRKGIKWSSLAPDQKEALDMFAAKISRLLTGDPDYADNWDDIAGFSRLVADRVRK